MVRLTTRAAQLCLAAGIIAAATTPAFADSTTSDPYEGYNRFMFKVNDKVDQYLLTPVARGYRKVTPRPVRGAVGNFFNNFRDVYSFGSNLLRGNVKKAGSDFMRVAVNTTFGFGGLIDIADAAQMPNNKNTLGDTFASWGWKNSHYLVLPLLGPSTVRDGIGTGLSTAYLPQYAVIHDTPANYTLTVLNGIDTRERLLDATDTLSDMALDKYTLTRNAFLAQRNQQLGITPPPSADDELIDPEADWHDNAASEPSNTAPQAASQPVQSTKE